MVLTYFKSAVDAGQCGLNVEWTAGLNEARKAGEGFDLAGKRIEEWRGEDIHA
jgi:hypothetical protein